MHTARGIAGLTFRLQILVFIVNCVFLFAAVKFRKLESVQFYISTDFGENAILIELLPSLFAVTIGIIAAQFSLTSLEARTDRLRAFGALFGRTAVAFSGTAIVTFSYCAWQTPGHFTLARNSLLLLGLLTALLLSKSSLLTLALVTVPALSVLSGVPEWFLDFYLSPASCGLALFYTVVAYLIAGISSWVRVLLCR